MASLTKTGTASGAALAAAKGAAVPEGTGDAGLGAQDEAECGRLSKQVEKRIMDIETGKVKMTRYTLNEYMRHLDDILGS